MLRAVKRRRRHQESQMTLQEMRSRKRMGEACEEVGSRTVGACRAGGSPPQGLIRQAAKGRMAQPRAVTERLSRRE